jgi:hypothetical protein
MTSTELRDGPTMQDFDVVCAGLLVPTVAGDSDG